VYAPVYAWDGSLFVVFTRRRGRVRAITARDATPEEKRRYRKRGK
jgi:uncharacterized DUF497 family protein